MNAIQRIASGRPYISTAVAEQLAINLMPEDVPLPHKTLSDREFEIFQLLVQGKALTEIADGLFLSVKTVSTHKTNIMHKMHVDNFAELIHYAIAHQLMTPAEF